MPYSLKQKYDDRLGNSQSMLLQEIKNVLKAEFPLTYVKGSGPIVEVGFSDYNVEVAPVWGNIDEYSYICITSDGGRYKRAQYEDERLAVSLSDIRTSGNTRHLIRMLKCWQSENNVGLKSFHLELLAIAFLDQWAHAGKSKTWYDWMCRDFFKYLLTRQNTNIFVPGTLEVIFIGDAWASKARTAFKNASKATENEGDDIGLASVYWRYIFGNQMKFRSN